MEDEMKKEVKDTKKDDIDIVPEIFKRELTYAYRIAHYIIFNNEPNIYHLMSDCYFTFCAKFYNSVSSELKHYCNKEGIVCAECANIYINQCNYLDNQGVIHYRLRRLDSLLRL
jgi:hypothetical protein